jgi:hypothetical protein
VTAIGIVYMGVIMLWLWIESSPTDPIGDPYLAFMEALTIGSALALGGLVAAFYAWSAAPERIYALLALGAGWSAATLTIAVHFVQLTAVRQMQRAGAIADDRLVWPSQLFAVEYVAWDLLIGLTMICLSTVCTGSPAARRARWSYRIGGLLCLVGSAGPLTGWMPIQNVALAGYGLLLPLATALTAVLFHRTPPAS